MVSEFRNAVVAWWNDKLYESLSNSEIKGQLDRIKKLGFDGITFDYAIKVDLSTGKAANPDLARMWEFVDYTKSLGLNVQVKTHITDANFGNLNLWTSYKPGFSYETLFNDLNSVLTPIAAEAQRHATDVFYVGTENNSFDTASFHTQWQHLISSVRSVYAGTVSYDALYLSSQKEWGEPHTNDYGVTGIWDLVDAASLSLYPQLSNSPLYDKDLVKSLYFYKEEMANYSIVNDLITFANTLKKPLYIGEIGFNATDLALAAGISDSQLIKTPLNEKLQAVAWESFLELLGNNLSQFVQGINTWEYNLWAMQDAFQNPHDAATQLIHDVNVKGFSLQEHPFAEAAISKYLQNPWNFHTSNITLGGAGDDLIYVSSGNNQIHPNGGSDHIHGGLGIDTVFYTNAISQYRISTLNGSSIVSNSISKTTDNLTNIERLKFTDINIALDIGKGEASGSAYRLYKAAFDRTPDKEGLGYWINSFDHGASLSAVATAFIASNEFIAMYGANSSDTQFVNLLYSHVLHRTPDAGGSAYWLNALANGNSRGAVLASFSESPENISQTASLIANGIDYQEWV